MSAHLYRGISSYFNNAKLILQLKIRILNVNLCLLKGMFKITQNSMKTFLLLKGILNAILDSTLFDDKYREGYQYNSDYPRPTYFDDDSQVQVVWFGSWGR